VADMNCVRTDKGDETVLVIDGILDALTAPDLRGVIERVVGEVRTSITIDLSALRLIDSSGVGVIVSLYKRARAAGALVRIVGMRDQPRAIFRLLRLDRVFAV
jgi:anti-sigma B factor antagonist